MHYQTSCAATLYQLFASHLRWSHWKATSHSLLNELNKVINWTRYFSMLEQALSTWKARIGKCSLHLCISDRLPNVRYADDIALCSISWQDLFHMMVVLHEELGFAGLEINNANFHNKITKLPYVHWDCEWHGWNFVWYKHPEIPCKINPLEISDHERRLSLITAIKLAGRGFANFGQHIPTGMGLQNSNKRSQRVPNYVIWLAMISLARCSAERMLEPLRMLRIRKWATHSNAAFALSNIGANNRQINIIPGRRLIHLFSWVNRS